MSQNKSIARDSRQLASARLIKTRLAKGVKPRKARAIDMLQSELPGIFKIWHSMQGIDNVDYIELLLSKRLSDEGLNEGVRKNEKFIMAHLVISCEARRDNFFCYSRPSCMCEPITPITNECIA